MGNEGPDLWWRRPPASVVKLGGMSTRVPPRIVSDGLWERVEPLLPRKRPRFRYPGRKPAAQHACRSGSPDLELYRSVRERAGAQRATLTAARKIVRRCFHTLATAPDPA